MAWFSAQHPMRLHSLYSTKDRILSTKPSEDMMAGAFAGGLARFLVAPLDVVKIRLQIQTSTGAARKYGGIMSTMRVILKEEGLFAFWKGNLTATLMIAPYSATTFTVNQIIKNMWLGQNTAPVPAVSAVSGAIAGLCSTLVIYPLDLIRTRLAAQLGTQGYQSIYGAIADTCSGPRGWLGLYTGLSSALVGMIPYMGVQFALYDYTRAYLNDKHEHIDEICDTFTKTALGLGAKWNIETVMIKALTMCKLGLWVNKYTTKDPVTGTVHISNANLAALHDPTMTTTTNTNTNTSHIGQLPGWIAPMAGLVAGAGGKAVSFPFDVVKKRYQVLTFQHNPFANTTVNTTTTTTTTTSMKETRIPSLREIVTQMVRKEGVGSLYKGFSPAVVKTGLASSLTFALYELGLQLITTSKKVAARQL